VLSGHITTIAVSPSSNERIIAVGDNKGSLGVWNFDQRYDFGSSSGAFPAHTDNIRCIKFNPANPKHIYMASYDGRFRLADLDKLMFGPTLITENDDRKLTAFNFSDNTGNVVAIGDYRGNLIVKDVRTQRGDEDVYDVHDRTIKSVSFHPKDSVYLATSSSDSQVKIFDIRKLSGRRSITEPVVTITNHKKSLDSAFFSPVTGNQILTTSVDNTVQLHDTSVLVDSKVKLLHKMVLNTSVGTQATWHPRREDIFFLGSMDFPRKINMYSSDQMKIIHSYCDKNFTSLCTVYDHHPTLNFFVGGACLGKVYAFHG